MPDWRKEWVTCVRQYRFSHSSVATRRPRQQDQKENFLFNTQTSGIRNYPHHTLSKADVIIPTRTLKPSAAAAFSHQQTEMFRPPLKLFLLFYLEVGKVQSDTHSLKIQNIRGKILPAALNWNDKRSLLTPVFGYCRYNIFLVKKFKFNLLIFHFSIEFIQRKKTKLWIKMIPNGCYCSRCVLTSCSYRRPFSSFSHLSISRTVPLIKFCSVRSFANTREFSRCCHACLCFKRKFKTFRKTGTLEKYVRKCHNTFKESQTTTAILSNKQNEGSTIFYLCVYIFISRPFVSFVVLNLFFVFCCLSAAVYLI